VVRRGTLGPSRAEDVRLHHGSMLGHAAVARANLLFVYGLALSPAFLASLHDELAQQLPVGALVLLRGKGLIAEALVARASAGAELPPMGTEPAPAAAEPVPASGAPASSSSAARCLLPALETTIVNRVHQYYGYRVVDADAASALASAAPRTLVLEEVAAPLSASSRFERRHFVVPAADEPDCGVRLDELLDGDGDLDEMLGARAEGAAARGRQRRTAR
jgi:hypothetical protein